MTQINGLLMRCSAISGGGRHDKRGEIRVWDAGTGLELLTLKGHSNGIYGVAFSPDGNRIVSGSADNTAKIWDVSSLMP